MEPVPRTLTENFETLYSTARRLDRRKQRLPVPLAAGGRLGSTVGLSDNLNNARATGQYQANSATSNTPLPTGSFLVEVAQLGSETVTQRAHRYATFPDDFDQEWTRRYTASGGWGPWHLRSMSPADFTPEWIGPGVLAGAVVYARYSVADGTAHVELFQRFGSGDYGDLRLRNPLAAYVNGRGSVAAVQCAGRYVSAGTTALGTPAGLVSTTGDRLYARCLVVSGGQIVSANFSDLNPGGMTSAGGLMVAWSFPL